jgi:uncharacterized protein YegL
MKQGYTHISAIIDRSGSMSTIKTDTEGGFNTFLKEQQELPGEATISLTTFDDRIELDYGMIPIKDAPIFSLQPRGMTAMLDAIGVTIKNLGTKLAAMDEANRPEKVLVVILTDGQENSSREYTYQTIKAMITEQTEVWKWEFLFLGANQDAVLAGEHIGISAGKSMSYAPNSASVGNTFKSISKSSSAYRMSARGISAPDFNAQDRVDSMLPDPTTNVSAGVPKVVQFKVPAGQVAPMQSLIDAQKDDPGITVVTNYPIGFNQMDPVVPATVFPPPSLDPHK